MVLGGAERRIGLDGIGVDAIGLGDALGERRQLDRLQKGDQLPGIEVRHAGGGKRRAGIDIVVERDQLARHARLVGIGGDQLAALGLLDLIGAGEQRIEVAVFADQRARRLDADAGDAGDVVGGVADQGLDVDDLLGRHAEIIDDALAVEAALGPVAGLAAGAGFEIVELDGVGDELHQVLVGGDDEHVGAGGARLLGVGGDDVVGLVARLLHRLEAEGAHRLAHEGELRLEVVGHLAAGALVVGVDLLAEGLLRLVEDDCQVGRPDADGALADELIELGAEEAQGAGGQAVGAVIVFGVLVDRLEIGAEDEGRAIDQKDVVAGLEGGGRGGSVGGGGFRFRHGGTMTRAAALCYRREPCAAEERARVRRSAGRPPPASPAGRAATSAWRCAGDRSPRWRCRR